MNNCLKVYIQEMIIANKRPVKQGKVSIMEMRCQGRPNY